MEVDRLGVRRLWALINGLPQDAAFRRDSASAWTQDQELAAAVIEVLDFWGRSLVATLIQLNVPRDKARQALKGLPDPVRVTRPGSEPETPPDRKPVASPSEIRRFMQKVG